MVEEAHAEEVEHFAFIPVGAAPDAGDGIDCGLGARQAALQAQALIAFDGVQVVDDFEARFGGVAVDGGDRAHTDESPVVLQKSADAGDFGRSDLQRQLAMCELAGFDGVAIECVHGDGRGMLFQMIG